MNIKTSFSHKNMEPQRGFLYVVGTPIGNLEDLSSRALNILKNVSLIACEDTRQTKKIMNKFEFTNTLMSFNQHNSLNKIPKMIDDLIEKRNQARISKDFSLADDIRDKLLNMGIVLEDKNDITTWKKR